MHNRRYRTALDANRDGHLAEVLGLQANRRFLNAVLDLHPHRLDQAADVFRRGHLRESRCLGHLRRVHGSRCRRRRDGRSRLRRRELANRRRLIGRSPSSPELRARTLRARCRPPSATAIAESPAWLAFAADIGSAPALGRRPERLSDPAPRPSRVRVAARRRAVDRLALLLVHWRGPCVADVTASAPTMPRTAARAPGLSPPPQSGSAAPPVRQLRRGDGADAARIRVSDGNRGILSRRWRPSQPRSPERSFAGGGCCAARHLTARFAPRCRLVRTDTCRQAAWSTLRLRDRSLRARVDSMDEACSTGAWQPQPARCGRRTRMNATAHQKSCLSEHQPVADAADGSDSERHDRHRHRHRLAPSERRLPLVVFALVTRRRPASSMVRRSHLRPRRSAPVLLGVETSR